jgi:signal transduction histidine kinase
MRRDGVLVAIALVAAAIETAVRDDLVWPVVSVAVVVLFAGTLPWRRVHPLGVVVVAFGTVSVIDVVALVQDTEWTGLNCAVFVLVLPYALTRWGSGREVGLGLVVLSVVLGVTVMSGDSAGDVIGGAVVLLLACAIGGMVRYSNEFRDQEVATLRSHERAELARELHDTVAHHVSAIAVRAQAGRAVAAGDPDAAVDALIVIEDEASRALEEMRSMVGALRNGDQPDLTPQQGALDITRLAADGPGPRIEVTLDGDLAGLRPSVDAACYRLAQEAITNAVRHARHATVVRVGLVGRGDSVELSVVDDGRAQGSPSPSGFGLVGMAERVKLLGGTFAAGPNPDGGWTVEATLPSDGDNG